MLMLRLQRVGRKHNPSFRVVVTEKQNSSKSGRFLEVIGWYDARGGNKKIDSERAAYWISQGAKPTVTVHNMLVDRKVVSGKKVDIVAKRRAYAKRGEVVAAPTSTEKPTEKKEEEVAAPEVAPTEAPAEEAKQEDTPAA